MNAEELSKLVREYRPTMDKDILHSWASDIVAALSAAPSPAGEAIREAAAKIAEAAYAENSISRWAGDYIASLIRAMPIPAPVALPKAGEVPYHTEEEIDALVRTLDDPSPKALRVELVAAMHSAGQLVRDLLSRSTPAEIPADAAGGIDICPDCSGAGGDNNVWTCPHCNGSGGIAVVVTQADRDAAADVLFHVDGDPHVDNVREGWEDDSYLVQAFARHRSTTPTPPSKEVREALIAAFEAGAMAVHGQWQQNPCEAPRGDPEFGEAARDCAADLLPIAPSDQSASAVAGEGREPCPDTFDLKHDEAWEWITANCMAIRRDNGDMDYSLGAMIKAYEAGKAAAIEQSVAAVQAEADRLIADDYIMDHKDCIDTIREKAALPQAGEVEPELRLEWRDGPPPKPWSEEWFIALTIYGGRVVLRALPEEYTYDFTTADDTYMMAKNIKRWMQFPDSEYIAPDTGPPSSVIPAAAVGEDRPYGVGADYSVTALLIQTFERWLEMGPNAQPHYPGGNRPWSTGDLKWMIEQLSALPTPSEGLTERYRAALRALLERDMRKTCQHDETHRGGFLWEICDQCGAKWADDEGGKPEWRDPVEWTDAIALLDATPEKDAQ